MKTESFSQNRKEVAFRLKESSSSYKKTISFTEHHNIFIMNDLGKLKHISNPKLRRLPSIRAGITLIILDDPHRCLQSEDENLYRNLMDRCFVLRYTEVSQSLKYLKKVSSREYVIVLLNNLDEYKQQSLLTTLDQCQQIQAIFIRLSSTNGDDTHLNMHSNLSAKKPISRFCDSEALLRHLQQLIAEMEDVLKDDGLFTMHNTPEKALQDLRRELGSFVWTHTFRG
jgi:hypothetical protein